MANTVPKETPAPIIESLSPIPTRLVQRTIRPLYKPLPLGSTTATMNNPISNSSYQWQQSQERESPHTKIPFDFDSATESGPGTEIAPLTQSQSVPYFASRYRCAPPERNSILGREDSKLSSMPVHVPPPSPIDVSHVAVRYTVPIKCLVNENA